MSVGGEAGMPPRPSTAEMVWVLALRSATSPSCRALNDINPTAVETILTIIEELQPI